MTTKRATYVFAYISATIRRLLLTLYKLVWQRTEYYGVLLVGFCH